MYVFNPFHSEDAKAHTVFYSKQAAQSASRGSPLNYSLMMAIMAIGAIGNNLT